MLKFANQTLSNTIEEVAFRWGFIGADEFRLLGEEMSKTDYGRHFISILDEAGRA